MRPSPEAAAELLLLLDDGELEFDADEEMGQTDCPEGCCVEPDGYCCHGYESAALTAQLI